MPDRRFNMMTLGRASNWVYRKAMRWKAGRVLSRHSTPLKLHVGCGPKSFDGWVHLDAERAGPHVDVIWDLRWGLPCEENSCRFIYSEHVLEHLNVVDGLRFLRACHRCLAPDGVVRIAMPSLDVLIEKSAGPNWRDQDWLTWPAFQYIQTRAEMLNISFRAWGHQWLYDRVELHRRLKEAGFSRIVDCEWCASGYDELRDREWRQESQLICEASR